MKRHQKLTDEGRAFVERVRACEAQLFPELLDPAHPRRMLSGRYSWHYRPSHHAARGLVRASDLEALSAPGARLLSVGAHPACLERLLCALGLPPENLVVADADPALAEVDGAMQKLVFDLLEPWPEIGRFDLVLFPESLCIALSDRIAREGPDANAVPGPFPDDLRQGRLLFRALGEALDRLRDGGEIRADGPMSHPNVVREASRLLDAAGRHHRLDYDRFFLRVRASDAPSVLRFV